MEGGGGRGRRVQKDLVGGGGSLRRQAKQKRNEVYCNPFDVKSGSLLAAVLLVPFAEEACVWQAANLQAL